MGVEDPRIPACPVGVNPGSYNTTFYTTVRYHAVTLTMNEGRTSPLRNVWITGKKGRAAWLAAAVLAALLAALLVGCGAKTASSSTAPAAGGAAARQGGQPAGGPGRGRAGFAIPVQAEVVQFGPLDATHTSAATVVPVTQSNVATQVSGVVRTVLHQAGDWVTAGETVIQLDDSQLKLAYDTALGTLKTAQINLQVGQQNVTRANPQLQAQLQAAQSTLSAAQRNYSALEAGAKLGGVSASALDTAQSQLQQAQANYVAAQTALSQNQDAATQNIAQLKVAVETAQNQLDQAKLNLSDASIAAPFAGQIAAVNVTPGEYVSSNTPAFVLVSPERQISFSVAPTDAGSLPTGYSVTFTTTGKPYPARINQTPSAPINGVVPLTATFVNSDPPAYGTVGTVSYTVNLTQGILVPLNSLQNDGSQNYVFAIESGKAHFQPITILAETGATAAVSGLATGAHVIVNPPPGLLDGANVTAVSPQAQGTASAQPAAPGQGQSAQGAGARSGNGSPGTQQRSSGGPGAPGAAPRAGATAQ
ncbi:MAG TPA: efflux RND transporter periplasmic adaptor subunit [Spirochaetia bacterium]|nr:efflux RND transporter periplasmic adaptor subunit [Spirochaetia bacterium]